MNEYLPTAVICAKAYLRSHNRIKGGSCAVPLKALLECIARTHPEFSGAQMPDLIYHLKILGHLIGSDDTSLVFNDSFCPG